MIILPAIDIKDGQCVRLTKGEFHTAKKVAEDPIKTAESFATCGAKWLHMVDLDGALGGQRINSHVFIEIAKVTGLKVELGGGIRNMESVEYYLENGIDRVILGTAAIENPDFVKEAVAKYKDKIAVGIDAKNGLAAGGGWLCGSNIYFIDLAKQMEKAGVETIIYTDIAKDGTLTGPNLKELGEINDAVSCNVIASGGIHMLSDIEKLKDIGLYGAICGKSIYQGTLSLKEALSVC